MEGIKYEITKNLKFIKELINNEDNNILLENINLCLKDEISKIKNKKNINKVPIEITEKIFEYLSIKDLYINLIVCKKWKYIIENIIDKKIIYNIVFNQYKNTFSTKYYKIIKCDNCNYYMSEDKYYKKSKFKYSLCKLCKYKTIHNINHKKKIINLEINCIFNNHNLNTDCLFDTINNIYDNTIITNIIFSIYTNSNYIYNTRQLIYNILNKSQENVYIYNEGLFSFSTSETINIFNNKLKSLIIPMEIISKIDNIKLLNIEKIYIYNKFDINDKAKILNIYDNICKSKKIKEIIINKENIFIFKDYIFPNNIILGFLSKEYYPYNNLNCIFRNNNINTVILYGINKYYIELLNNYLSINKILINKRHNFKYLKNYDKIQKIEF